MKARIAKLGLVLATLCINSAIAANESAKAPDMSAYMNGVKIKMQGAWRAPDVPERCTVSVLFSIDKSGAVVSSVIKQTSGQANVDQLALAAVRKASPFAKLPEGTGKFSVNYSFECGPHKSADSILFNGVPIKNQEYKMSSGGATLRNLDTDSPAERKLQERAFALRNKSDLMQKQLDELLSAAAPDNTKVSATMRDLANTYKQLQQYDKAEPLYKSLIVLEEKSDNPSALMFALSDFGNMYYVTGKFAEAEPFYERAVSLQNKIDGQHANKQTLSEYAKTLYKLNKISQADEIYKQLRVLQ